MKLFTRREFELVLFIPGTRIFVLRNTSHRGTIFCHLLLKIYDN